jgi:hypothetical protein
MEGWMGAVHNLSCPSCLPVPYVVLQLCYADAILVRFLVRERSSCAPRLPSTTLLTWYHHPAIARRHGQLQAPFSAGGGYQEVSAVLGCANAGLK